MKILKIAICVLTLFGVLELNAQIATPAKIEVFKTFVENSDTNAVANMDFLMDLDAFLAEQNDFEITVVTELLDTVGLDSIKLNVWTEEGGEELFTQIYEFDGPLLYPNGSTYKREELIVYLNIGTYYDLEQFYIELQLSNANGETSERIYYDSEID